MKILGLGKNRRIEYFLFFIILVLGIIFTFTISPFQKADETAHFFRGVGLSNKGIVCEQDTEGNSYFNVQRKYLNYAERVGAWRIYFNYKEKFFFDELKSAEEDSVSEEIAPFYGFCLLPFPAYIPTAISVLIGDLFKSVSLSFYLSRLINFVIFFVALLWSYNRMKDSKLRWILIAYAMIPMVTHQASTIGYDALQLAIAPILFALNVSFIEKKGIKKKDLWVYFISMFLLLSAKIGYYFMSLLYFLIPREKITKDKKKYILYTCFFFLLCAIPLILHAISSNPSGLINYDRNINPTEQLRDLIEHPLSLILLIKNTLGRNMYFYIGSFIGHFGWLDYSISSLAYVLFILSWLLLISRIRKEKGYNKLSLRTLILGASIFLTIGSIFGALYLTWTPVGNAVVDGVQGRYFLILFPFLMLFAIYFSKLFESKKLLQTILLFLFIFYVLFELSYVIYKRYYDYSYVYKDNSYSMIVEREVLRLKKDKILLKFNG